MFDLSQAPFKEIPVDRDTNDAAAKQARESLQTVLDDHVAAPYDPDVKSQKNKKKARGQSGTERPKRHNRRPSQNASQSAAETV